MLKFIFELINQALSDDDFLIELKSQIINNPDFFAGTQEAIDPKLI